MQRAASASAVRWKGGCDALSGVDRRALFDRTAGIDAVIGERTSSIIARVRRDGDDALRALAVELDGVDLKKVKLDDFRRQVGVVLQES